MFKVNSNFAKLPGSYLFSTIAKKVAAYSEANPNADIIRLGIGDVTQPIAPAMRRFIVQLMRWVTHQHFTVMHLI